MKNNMLNVSCIHAYVAYYMVTHSMTKVSRTYNYHGITTG